MNKLLYISLASTAVAGLAFGQGAADYPPESDAGSCFARVLIPEMTEVVTEQVIDRPESTEIKVVAAQYQTVTEQILVKEETVRYEVVPAVYETVTEQVIATLERTETIVVPAQFETYSEQVLVRPAYTTWKPGNGLYGRGAAGVGTSATNADGTISGNGVATGELLCRVEVPAQYDTVTRTRLAMPERTETNVIPATYKTVSKEVVSQPSRVVETVVPAVYDTVSVQKMVSPAMEDTIVIPATYRTVEKRVVTGGGGLEWRQVLCDTNASSAKIAEVQRALSAKGYTLPADGSFGPATLRAMEDYQRSNGLPVGYLTVGTVQSLGLTAY